MIINNNTNWHPLIRQFLDERSWAAVAAHVSGRPCFRDGLDRGEFLTWLRRLGYDVDESAVPVPGPDDVLPEKRD